MNTSNIRSIANAIDKAAESVRVMRNQRAVLGTGNGACQKVYIEVVFDNHGSQRLKLDEGRCSTSPLMAS